MSGSLLPASPSTTFAAETSFSPNSQSNHRKIVTDPSPSTSTLHSPSFQHTRAATDNPVPSRFALSQPHVLRKPAPRAQVPISVIQDTDAPEDTLPLRTHMPSTISAGVENMTGIGTSPNILYTAAPFEAGGKASSTPISFASRRGDPIDHGRPPLNDRVKTPPLLTASPALPFPQKPSLSEAGVPKEHTSTDSHPAPLLGIGTFRDSAFSAQSEMSYEIPIKWTGPVNEEPNTKSERSNPKPNRLSGSPMFPEGWQPTPIEEKEEDELGQQRTPSLDGRLPASTPIHEIGSRIGSPDIVKSDVSLRKSEAALVRIIQDITPPPSLPNVESSQRKEPPNTAVGGGQGWVLVNVENSNNPSPTVGPEGSPRDVHGVRSRSSSGPGPSFEPPMENSPAAAKAIVIIDSMDSKHKKSQSTSNSKDGREGSSGVRRFFSLNKKNSVREFPSCSWASNLEINHAL